MNERKGFVFTVNISDFEYDFGTYEFEVLKNGNVKKPNWNEIKSDILIAIKALMQRDADLDVDSDGVKQVLEAETFDICLYSEESGFNYFEYKNPFCNR